MPDHVPNNYDLAHGGLHVTYRTIDVAGKNAHVTYEKDGKSESFSGGQINTERTAIGTLVSVQTDVVADGPTTSFTIVIPDVNLGDKTSLDITTFGVTTVHASSLIGPPPGQTETYTTTVLKGVANVVKTAV